LFLCRVEASEPLDFRHPFMEKVLEFLLKSSGLIIPDANIEASRTEYRNVYNSKLNSYLAKVSNVVTIYNMEDYNAVAA
jgi:hypothetical protein